LIEVQYNYLTIKYAFMNNTIFNLALLPSFLAVLDHLTLVKAAKFLGLSQPTLGRHLLELEEQLGVVLFERTGRGLMPTPQAIQLSTYAREIESQASALYRLAKSRKFELKGRVRISASQAVACVLLPSVLARMQDALPEIDIDLVSTNNISNLLRREADIALRMVKPNQDSLITKKIAEVRVVACAHASYIKRNGQPSNVLDLLNHRMIGSETNTEIDKHAKSLGFDPQKFNYSFRSDDYIAQWAAIQSGLGIGFTADYVAASDPKVTCLLPDLRLPALPVWLTVHREIRGSGPIRAVYDFLAKEVPAAIDLVA
jgi:DNA-binding transcriptional LysR family regulator